ncbi:putative lipoprotein [[Enterobacter] lignolyticus SCF1]|uniref:Lipoprotein n=2 Tax=[Enterobacter] lignolyticus TaxID=1334193 RepID=E3GBA2_ENTLS|nr:putative lipoprotein [[Enterobacter] lignolyticus SCF1]
MTSTGLIVDGKPATIIEKEPQAKVYQQGLFNYVVYSNGKIGVTDTSGVFKGYAK